MLSLTRREKESIVIDAKVGRVEIVVLEARPGRVRLAISAPRDWRVDRSEVAEARQRAEARKGGGE